MNEKDLRYFCAAYECKNISRAAEQVYLTPQGLSKAIIRLENELEVSLFTRSQVGIIPTTYADALYSNSQEIIESLKNMKDRIVNIGNEKKKELVVAYTLGVIDYLGVDYILDFQRAFPDIKLTIIQNPDVRVDDMIRSEQVEMGIIAGPIDTTIYDGKLFTMHHHCLVMHKDHPLAKKDFISYKDLDGEPLALEGREFRPYHNNMNRFMRNQVTPQIVLESTEIESTHRFASNNNGIGLSVDFCAHAHPYGNTVIRPFEDAACTWETYMVTKKGRILSDKAKDLMEFSYGWLEEHQTQLFHWDPWNHKM